MVDAAKSLADLQAKGLIKQVWAVVVANKEQQQQQQRRRQQ
jgi:hypothetical protein